jgi:hypothetical protein
MLDLQGFAASLEITGAFDLSVLSGLWNFEIHPIDFVQAPVSISSTVFPLVSVFPLNLDIHFLQGKSIAAPQETRTKSVSGAVTAQ